MEGSNIMRKLILTLALAVGFAGAVSQASTAQASSSCTYSPRGCVHVSGYYTGGGTYVRPYVRNYPTRPSYRPSYGSGCFIVCR